MPIGPTLPLAGANPHLQQELNFILQATSDGGSQAPSAPGSAPDSVLAAGRYELRERFDQGGMGFVFRAWDRHLCREVAVKILKTPEVTDEQLERFRNEARTAANLRHPHIVTVFDYGEQRRRPFLVMEFLQGGTLCEQMQERKADWRATLELCQKIVEAVAYLHSQNIVHRDLKPANILCDAAGEPKVTDFGLAKMVTENQHLTQTGQVVGTPLYMAPEQIVGIGRELRKTVDVWSLGVILYEVFTGVRPFDAPSHSQVLEKVLAANPPAPREFAPDLPAGLERVILTCLARRPNRRYQHAGQLASDLARVAKGNPPTEALRLRRLARTGAFARLAGIVAAGLLLVWLGGWLVRGLSKPDSLAAIRPIMAKAAAGEPVHLIKDRGRPAWSAFQGEHFLLNKLESQPFAVEAMDTCLVTLLPEIGREDYTVEAKLAVAKPATADNGCIGLFLQADREQNPQRFLAFAIHVREPSFLVSIRVVDYFDGGGKTPDRCHANILPLPEVEVTGRLVDTLQVQKQGRRLRWTVNDTLVHEGDVADLLKRFQIEPGSHPSLASRGAVGLYLFKAAARCDSFSVRP